MQIQMEITGDVGYAAQRVDSSTTWDHTRLRSATGIPSSGTSFGIASYEFVGVIGTGDYQQSEQLQANFDFSSIPADAIVTAGEIRFTQLGSNPGQVNGSPSGALTTRLVDGAGHDLPISTSDYRRTDIGTHTALVNDIAYNGLDGNSSHALNSAGVTAVNSHIALSEGMKFTGISVDLLNNLDYNFDNNTPWGYNTALLDTTSTLVLTMLVADEGMMGINF